MRRLAGLGPLRRFSQPGRLTLERHLLARERGPEAGPVVLRGDQTRALDELLSALAGRRFERFLLQGVTGSGNTEVYLRAAEATVAAGRSVLLLVPEIALVPALARAVAERFGARSFYRFNERFFGLSGFGRHERHYNTLEKIDPCYFYCRLAYIETETTFYRIKSEAEMTTQAKTHIPWYLGPLAAIWKLLTVIVVLTGRLVAMILGILLMIVGLLVSLTVIGAIIGVPLAIVGLLLFLKGMF